MYIFISTVLRMSTMKLLWVHCIKFTTIVNWLNGIWNWTDCKIPYGHNILLNCDSTWLMWKLNRTSNLVKDAEPDEETDVRLPLLTDDPTLLSEPECCPIAAMRAGCWNVGLAADVDICTSGPTKDFMCGILFGMILCAWWTPCLSGMKMKSDRSGICCNECGFGTTAVAPAWL